MSHQGLLKNKNFPLLLVTEGKHLAIGQNAVNR
jgi:hypothetical protein